MFRTWLLTPLADGPDDGSGGGAATGTTDNITASVTGGATEPSSSGNITSGTASDAMIKAAMAASSAEDTSASVQAGIVAPQKPASDAAVTDPTKDAKGPQAPAQPQGEAPPTRIEAAVRNARAAAIAETRKEYAWAEGVSAEGGTVALDITRQMAADPKKFATELATELGFKLVPVDAAAQEPQPRQAGDPTRPFPKGKLRSEDGLEAYSADQMPEIVAIITDQIRAEMQGHMKPLMDDRREAAEIRTRETIRQEARVAVRGTLEHARKLPHFQVSDGKGGMVDHPAIMKNLEAIPKAERVAMGPKAALFQAYNQYLAETVFPNINTEAEKRVRANWGKKAATSMGSGHPVPQGGDGKPTEIRGVSELARHMERLAAAQGA